MASKRQIKNSSKSRVIQTSRVFPNDLNDHNTIFGGKILSLIDMTSSISVARHTRKSSVTASIDSVDFINSAWLEDSICAESFVSGVGNSSVEVFCKIVAENLITGERRLCATAFTTFTCFEEDGSLALVPLIKPETDEEKYINQGYIYRRKDRIQGRYRELEMQENVSTETHWVS